MILLFCACSSLKDRVQSADELAKHAGMTKSYIKTGSFTLASYKKITSPGQEIIIYIEGDGFAWASKDRISTNPTPKEPFVLSLAVLDKSPNVVYLARPCQYAPLEMNKVACDPKFWSGSRFSKEVVESINQAVDSILKEANARKVNLIGYSGGGAIAVILAARRSDVASLRTVAGNLDHVAVNNYHKVSQLDDSINPADYAARIVDIPQLHFVGGHDEVVPEFLAQGFIAKQRGNCAKIYVVKDATHYAGWKENWPELLDKKLAFCN
jgi:hypothetical protein